MSDSWESRMAHRARQRSGGRIEYTAVTVTGYPYEPPPTVPFEPRHPAPIEWAEPRVDPAPFVPRITAPSAGDTLIWLWVTATGAAEVTGHPGVAVVCGLAAASLVLAPPIRRRHAVPTHGTNAPAP